MLSAACRDAIRAMIYIAKKQQETNDFISIKEIAKELNLSFYFLSKILQKLVKSGFLESYRGPNGGVKLSRPAYTISIYDIVRAVDGDSIFKACILGFEECSDKNPCAIHDKWAIERDHIYNMFKETNLEEIEEKLEKEKNIKI